ncbi:MAG: MFS transporter [Fusobacteriaceae bacterium]|nr:MFS transporter [Fusobacteriaceae bacterium]
MEFFREIPGLLVVLFLALMYKLSGTRVFKISVALSLAGMVGLLMAGSSKFLVVLFLVIYSIGDHLIMPVRSALSLSYAKEEKGGLSLGLTNALRQFGNIVGFGVVTILFLIFAKIGFKRTDIAQYKIVFSASIALLIASTLIAFAMKETAQYVPRRRFYFAKKFTKYYFLEVFYGARQQIFFTFAPYTLILHYHADAFVMSLLLGICAFFGTILSPIIGRIIDKLGYKTVMVGDTLILIVVCFFFGFSHRIFSPNTAYIVVCISFVFDSIVSIASMASTVYVRDIASDADEVMATLSTGISVNHVISILIALAGGWIWRETGIEVLFTLSAFLGLMNSIYAASIKKPKQS